MQGKPALKTMQSRSALAMNRAAITEKEFVQFQGFIYEAAGIAMSREKKALIFGRLAKRVQQFGFSSYGEYFNLLKSGTAPAEVQTAIDLLTTNETYFFREPKHFDFLREQAIAERNRARPFRVWSAACSSGEEVYSIAMVLADCLGPGAWEVVGSDISLRVLKKARAGHYPVERTRHIPLPYLQRFCLKGVKEQQGTLLVNRSLRDHVQFMQINLNEALPRLGQFDMVFLRNVMIYFNGDTKREVVERICATIKPDGHLCIGHSESLHDITDMGRTIAPSVYCKA
jgi:chemotaxis protein methyltransferase CheR